MADDGDAASEGKKEQEGGCVSYTAAEDVSEERWFSFGKQVLNLLLFCFFFVWWDFLGLWFLPGAGYILLLLVPWPASAPSTRMQVRSTIIIFFTLFSIPAVLLWCVVRGGRLAVALLAVYVAWSTLLDDAPRRGGRFCPALRKRAFWRHFATYFPMTLTRTVELDPKKNYVFGYHPHGIISVGALCNFATEGTRFSKLFPGIDLRLLTLRMNFYVPLLREYLLGLGINDASRESCERNLARGVGASIMLVVGGARESLETRPGQVDLILEHRKGFVKMAIKTGASLVPVLSFGESDVFGVYHSDRLSGVQLAMQKRMGFAIPLFFGRALTGGLLHRVFGLNVGIMPLRMPVRSVVGRPIDVERVKQPSQEQVDAVHALYVEELKHLYEDWKDVWTKEREAALLSGDTERLKIMSDSKFKLDRVGTLGFVD